MMTSTQLVEAFMDQWSWCRKNGQEDLASLFLMAAHDAEQGKNPTDIYGSFYETWEEMSWQDPYRESFQQIIYWFEARLDSQHPEWYEVAVED